MLHHFLEHLLIFASNFYFRILPLYPMKIWDNIGKILKARNSYVNGPIWPKFECIIFRFLWLSLISASFMKIQTKMNEIRPEHQFPCRPLRTVTDTTIPY